MYLALLINSRQDHFYEIEASRKKFPPILHVEVYDYDILSYNDLIGEKILPTCMPCEGEGIDSLNGEILEIIHSSIHFLLLCIRFQCNNFYLMYGFWMGLISLKISLAYLFITVL